MRIHFIRRLPDGYRTMLYSDGSNLSQGQRQLLAIARVAVAHPPVLILDEATSSIDTRTERLIEKGMDAIMEGRNRVCDCAQAFNCPQFPKQSWSWNTGLSSREETMRSFWNIKDGITSSIQECMN